MDEALQMVKMAGFAEARPGRLSGGQQQRVALARALVNRPQLLLLDEPLSALDANLRKEMQSELKALQREVGITFLFVTHDQEEAMALSDRIALLRNGSLEQIAAPREIYAHPATAYTAQFIGQTNLLRGNVHGGTTTCGALVWQSSAADGAVLYSLRPEAIQLAIDTSTPRSVSVFAGRYASRSMAAPANCSKSIAALRRYCALGFPLAARLAANMSLRSPPQTRFASASSRENVDPGDNSQCLCHGHRSRVNRHRSMYSRAYKSIVALPPLVWVGLFLLLPYALMFAHSFWLVRDGFLVHQWNLQNYQKLATNPLYVEVLLRTMRIAASVTFLSLLLGYPLAYYLSFHAGARKELLYQLVIVPLWVSYLVRGYAWKTILGSDGVLNGFLQYFHLTHAPVGFLLYSPFAVVVMLTHIYTPFVFLPIYAALEHIPRPLVEASQDLGASQQATFLRVILPLSMPGLLAGATFAFVLVARRLPRAATGGWPLGHHDREHCAKPFRCGI